MYILDGMGYEVFMISKLQLCFRTSRNQESGISVIKILVLVNSLGSLVLL